MKRATCLLVTTALLTGCGAITDSLDPKPGSVAMVLLDVSTSTQEPAIRERYLENLELVLDQLNAIDDPGSHLGGDAIDDNPLAHGGLRIREEFEPCGLLDNSRGCEADRTNQTHAVLQEMRQMTKQTSSGTDIIGGLRLADTYLSAYKNEDPERLILLSDMVQSSGQFSIRRILDEPLRLISRRVERTDVPDLSGVDVYVVGAGATAPDKLTSGDIRKIEAFWKYYFSSARADLVFYGSALPTFPL
jgi:hypothetical protein